MPARTLALPARAALLTLLLASTGAQASPTLNDTGIGFCIDADGAFIDCHGTGQDATYGRDVKHPRDDDGRVGFHFTKMCNSGDPAGQGTCPADPTPGDAPDEWGCTRDEVTKLVWETKTAAGTRAGHNRYTNFSPEYDPDGTYGGPNDATGYAKRVNRNGLCGASDWRLPAAVELMGIADMGTNTLPAIDERFMPNTEANFYWAGGQVFHTPFALQLAWGVDFAFGLGNIGSDFRESQRPVRLVRGSAPGGKRFTLSDDGQEVTDRHTGLVWRRCVEGMTFDGHDCVGKPLSLTWVDTLAHARKQARQTGVDWRLPNVKELASLLDHERHMYIDTKIFPGGQKSYLWSSSSFPADPTPRCLDFPDGLMFACSQGGNVFGARLVRDR